ncbi:hypothetical protein TNCV_938281 [Trichonephila clavipes]|nr:hypothetical protein TNCV_938281 [Trichonephila clavipes]
MTRNPVEMQGRKCCSCELWCEQEEKMNGNSNEFMGQKTFLNGRTTTERKEFRATPLFPIQACQTTTGRNFESPSRATIDLLKDTFGDRLISRFGPVNWPPRSCDLTPLDYFLWGYVKSLVYADKPNAWPFGRQHSPCYCRYTATNVGKSHRKLDVQTGLHLSQPWQSYARNHI